MGHNDSIFQMVEEHWSTKRHNGGCEAYGDHFQPLVEGYPHWQINLDHPNRSPTQYCLTNLIYDLLIFRYAYIYEIQVEGGLLTFELMAKIYSLNNIVFLNIYLRWREGKVPLDPRRGFSIFCDVMPTLCSDSIFCGTIPWFFI